MKNDKKKLHIGFIANAKFLSVLLEHFVERKLLISEEYTYSEQILYLSRLPILKC